MLSYEPGWLAVLGTRRKNKIHSFIHMRNFGPTNSMVPRLHQSNSHIKRKLRVWRAQKCIALIGAETVLTSAGPQTTPFHGGQYRDGNGNFRKLGPTYRHGTTFPQEECLYQMEGTGMENPKMYSSIPWKNPTDLCGSTNYPVS